MSLSILCTKSLASFPGPQLFRLHEGKSQSRLSSTLETSNHKTSTLMKGSLLSRADFVVFYWTL